MESREPSAAELRFRGFFSVIALVVVALVAVTVAMVTLGSTQPDYTPAPIAAAGGTATPAPSPTENMLPTDSPSPVATVRLPSTAPVILTVYENAHSPDHVWYVVWRYPQLRAGSTPLASLVNQDIIDEVQVRIDTFEAGPAAIEQYPGKVNTLTGSFYTNMSSPDLLSLTLKWVDDTSPAHEAIGISTLNYALNSGQRIDLLDLFTDQQAGLTIISTEARARLMKSLGADYDPTIAEPGTAAVATNFANWALTPAGLKITFDEYQVATYADGMPAVVIPWAKLHDVMVPNGPASRLAGFPPGSAGASGASASGGSGAASTDTPEAPSTELPTDTPTDFPTAAPS